MVSVALTDVPLAAAVIAADVVDVTFDVLTLKVVDVIPAGIVTVLGTVAFAFEVDSWTTSPPAGAGPVRVTVAVEDAPPVTLVGFRAIDKRVDGLIVN